MIKKFIKYHLRHGRVFKRHLEELQRSIHFSKTEIKEYQNEKLRSVIFSAYENVPYYRNVFKERKLRPQDIATVEDLKKLPLIDKDIVKTNFNNFINKNFKGYRVKAHTGGTTGNPSTYLRDLNSINFENAVLWRQFLTLGKPPGSRRITLRGELVCPSDRKRPPFWKNNYFSNELTMSTYHLNDTNMPHYISKIQRYKPYDLHAYPSSAYLLALYCL